MTTLNARFMDTWFVEWGHVEKEEFLRKGKKTFSVQADADAYAANLEAEGRYDWRKSHQHILQGGVRRRGEP